MKTLTKSLEQVHFKDLGRIGYKQAWDMQSAYQQANVQLKRAAGMNRKAFEVDTTHHLLFCEHHPVYTLGTNGNASNLLADEAMLKRIGAEFVQTDRGGDITYHGPGQLTGYPILDLERFKPDIGWYLRMLEEIMIRVLAEYGIKASRIPKFTGVWVDAHRAFPRKICALGVRCSRWVTMHGFGLNVNTDLLYFSHIVPCGIKADSKGVTSIQSELGGERIDMEEVKTKVRKHFAEVFGYEEI